MGSGDTSGVTSVLRAGKAVTLTPVGVVEAAGVLVEAEEESSTVVEAALFMAP